MHRALAGIHVEHRTVGSVERLRLSDQIAVHGHQPDEVVVTGQQLGLEPVQRRGQRRAPVPPRRRANQAERGIGRETLRVVEVFVARQAAVHRLSQEIGQPELRVQSVARVAQMRGDDPRKAKAFIQLTHQNQAGIGGEARPLKRDLQKSVERELKGLRL